MRRAATAITMILLMLCLDPACAPDRNSSGGGGGNDDPACVADFAFETPSGETVTIDACEAYEGDATYEFDPDATPEVRTFVLTFHATTEANWECWVRIEQAGVCGPGYYLLGEGYGAVTAATFDCSGVNDDAEGEFVFSDGYLKLTEIDAGDVTGNFSGEPLDTRITGVVDASAPDGYELRGDFTARFEIVAVDAEEGECHVHDSPDGDDDDATSDDDDDVTGDDDDAGDDDSTAGDDDDATSGDDDDATSGDDDDVTEPCCSDTEYPAYYVDSLTLTTFLESSSYNEFLNLLLVDALPPISDSVILLFDPDEDLVGDTSFQSRFGPGEVTQDLYSFTVSPPPVDWDYSQDANRNFTTVDNGLQLDLSFGVAVSLYNAEISGQFSADYSAIPNGAISGGIRETDTVNVETSFGNLHDLMDGRTLNADTDGNGTPDGWTFVMEFTGVQFM